MYAVSFLKSDHLKFEILNSKFPTLFPVLLVVGFMADCLTRDLGQWVGCPPWGVFLRDPSPYLRKFRRKPLSSEGDSFLIVLFATFYCKYIIYKETKIYFHIAASLLQIFDSHILMNLHNYLTVFGKCLPVCGRQKFCGKCS